MRALLLLSLRSAWNRRLTLCLIVATIALSVALLAGIDRVRQGAHDGFSRSVSGTDLVVGARGSPLQLMLYAVFHLGEATNEMSYASFEAIAARPEVEWAVPLSLGDSFRGFAVLGTTPAYFTHLRHGDDRALRLAGGRIFGAGPDNVFEAVLGAEVAARTGFKAGDRITLSHGAGGALAQEHDDKPFTVTGVLAATGTPVDRTVHVRLQAIEAIHLDWQGGARLPGLSVPAAMVRKFDLAPRRITAALVGLHSRSAVFKVQRSINQGPGEALSAVLPGVALAQLWQMLAVVERALMAVSAMALAAGLAGTVAAILAGLNERRRELAILRSVGARPRDLFLLLCWETIGLTLTGALLGMTAVIVAGAVFADTLQATYGLAMPQRLLGRSEFILLAQVTGASLLAGLLPAWRAYRLSLADGLTVRI